MNSCCHYLKFDGNMGQKLGKMNLLKYDLSLPTRNPQNLKQFTNAMLAK